MILLNQSTGCLTDLGAQSGSYRHRPAAINNRRHEYVALLGAVGTFSDNIAVIEFSFFSVKYGCPNSGNPSAACRTILFNTIANETVSPAERVGAGGCSTLALSAGRRQMYKRSAYWSVGAI